MKVNIKGLVFVGFAAAILSANAMAEGENIVTSKSYVDNKFQTLNNMTDTVHASGETVAGKYPDEAAVRAAIDSATTVTNFVVDSIVDSVTDKAPSQNAVYDALANKQDKDDGSTYRVSIGGTWDAIGNAFESGTYTNKVIGANGVLTIDVNATTDTSLANADSGEADVNKIPTAGAVKAYVDAHSDAANFVENTIDATHTAIAPSGQAVNSGLATKQNLDTGTAYVVSKGGAWQAMTSAVTAADSNTIAVETGTNGEAVISAVTSNVGDGETALVTGDAVYEYVQGITHGNNIPAQDPLKCTASTPCALVAELNTSTNEMEQHWRVMAVSANQSPAAGTLADAQ